MINRTKVFLGLALLAITCRCAAVDAQKPSVSATPVVVELFTSDGCSSCPRADAVLQTLQGKSVITISEHVDYWNHLGWVDRMSSPIFSERQKQYAKALGENGVYTPQMVVGGRQGFVGSQSGTARSAIANPANHCATTLKVSAQLQTGGKMAIQIKGVGKTLQKDQKLVVFAIEDTVLTLIKAGENGGRRLAHTDVARAMKIFDSADCNSSSNSNGDLEAILPGEYLNREQLKAVAFIQNGDSMQITAAGSSTVLDLNSAVAN